MPAGPLGVPMAQYDDEFRRVMRSVGMEEGETEEVLEETWKLGVKTGRQFAGYFGPEGESLHTFWKGVSRWKGRGAIFSNMREAHELLNRMKSQRVEEEKVMLDPTLDNPIDPRTNELLTKIWKQRYGFRLHPSQEGTHQILGSMWRMLQRRQIVASPVKGLHTLQSTGGIEPTKKQWQVGDLRLLTQDEGKEKEVRYRAGANPFLFLMALESMLRTLAKAGSYPVDDPDDDRTEAERKECPQVLNIDRELIEDHLAQCRAFVIEWSTKARPPDPGAVTRQLSRIDQRIRDKWCRLYREKDSKTFSRCIKETEAMAESLLAADLTKEMEKSPGPKGGRDGKGTRQETRVKVTKRKRERSPTPGPPKGAREGKGNGQKITFFPGFKIKGKPVKAARTMGTRQFCRFNSEKKCNKGAKCNFDHACSVLVSKDSICGAKHAPCDHSGKTI